MVGSDEVAVLASMCMHVWISSFLVACCVFQIGMMYLDSFFLLETFERELTLIMS